MVSGFTKSDPILGTIDLDDEYLQDQELVNKSTSGNLYGWGYDTYYNDYYLGYVAIGLGTTTTPIQIGAANNWLKISRGAQCGAAIKTDGTLWTWGRNDFGTVGDGTTTNKYTPVQIGTDTNWKEIACGYYSMGAIRTDGTLWTWGFNDHGQLALGDTTNRSSPTQVGSLTDWKKIYTYWRSYTAIKSDGTLWAWGLNEYYNLSIGDTTDRSSPVQVGTDNKWKQIGQERLGFKGLKTDGTVWQGGFDYRNWNGISNGFQATTPCQIGSDNDWKSISYTLLIKNNGTLWTTETGYLNAGIGVYQIGNLNDWKKAVGDRSNNIGAIKNDGTLWAWGNIYGNYSNPSPIQIGTQNNWIDISVNTYGFLAKSSG